MQVSFRLEIASSWEKKDRQQENALGQNCLSIIHHKRTKRWHEKTCCVGKLFQKIISTYSLISFLLSLLCPYNSSKSLMSVSIALKRSKMSTFHANCSTSELFKRSSETNLYISIRENKVNILKKIHA